MSTADQWVDCSSNNALPNLGAYAAAGHKWLARKVSEGTGYHWQEGDGVADQAHAHGLHVVHYHWLRPEFSAVAQANYFVSLLAGHTQPGDKVMNDFERSPVPDPNDAVRAAQLRDFNNRVQLLRPDLPVIVYTGNWYLDGRPAMQAECRRWDVVMSDYSGVTPLRNPYGLRYVAHQFTDHATVAGFPTPVDYNRWLATQQQEDDMSAAEVQDIKDKIQTTAEHIQANIDEFQARVQPLILASLTKSGAKVDAKALAALVTPPIIAALQGHVGGLTADQVTQAVRAGIDGAQITVAP